MANILRFIIRAPSHLRPLNDPLKYLIIMEITNIANYLRIVIAIVIFIYDYYAK